MEQTATIGQTKGGIGVTRIESVASQLDFEHHVNKLDTHVGALFSSGYDYPGRYNRWDIAYHSPLLVIEGHGLSVTITANGERGAVLLPTLAQHLAADGLDVTNYGDTLTATVVRERTEFTEEARSRQPSSFDVIRSLLACLHLDNEPHLGLYGAFGYDLLFQFEPIELTHQRDPQRRDIVLHLPDELLIADRSADRIIRYRYDFSVQDASTAALARTDLLSPPSQADPVPPENPKGAYAAIVAQAKERFARGELYEVVPSQLFTARCESVIEFSRTLREQNPAPYGFLINLGDEHLVGASPEMYVRVEGDTVETCPIAGTIARGESALADAEQIQTLLNSEKDEAELTMCTDVDRNDKARVCVPGTVRIVGRRQLELYSRLIHTVDHVKGTLRPDRDALDAFLTHMWAVTVTGAPKRWAAQFIEQHENAPRDWYGGAIGMLNVNGNMNTGLTLRTAQVRNKVALVRVGATLLFDSDPILEEAETELKASALLRALSHEPTSTSTLARDVATYENMNVFVVDHEDSFTLNLADYFRRTGATVTTQRWDTVDPDNVFNNVDLVVLSPGPGRPETFQMSSLIARLVEKGIPVFGVCLGLQGIVEFFGGTLHQFDHPWHGRQSSITTEPGALFATSTRTSVGRYHSLHALADELPVALRATAVTNDGVVMAVEHTQLPIWGVQFHPESLLSFGGPGGEPLIQRVLSASPPFH